MCGRNVKKENNYLAGMVIYGGEFGRWGRRSSLQLVAQLVKSRNCGGGLENWFGSFGRVRTGPQETCSEHKACLGRKPGAFAAHLSSPAPLHCNFAASTRKDQNVFRAFKKSSSQFLTHTYCSSTQHIALDRLFGGTDSGAKTNLHSD